MTASRRRPTLIASSMYGCVCVSVRCVCMRGSVFSLRCCDADHHCARVYVYKYCIFGGSVATQQNKRELNRARSSVFSPVLICAFVRAAIGNIKRKISHSLILCRIERGLIAVCGRDSVCGSNISSRRKCFGGWWKERGMHPVSEKFVIFGYWSR